MIKLTDLYAQPGYAPTQFQVVAPQMFNAFSQSAAKPPVRPSEDLTRVLALPRRPVVEIGSPRAHALVRMMTARFARPRTDACRCGKPREHGGFERECITTLNLTQAWALYELGCVQGLLGPIGVGHGKTILDILSVLAMMPPDEPDPRRYEAVLLVPPTLVEQLITEYLLLAEHFRVPSLAVHGRDEAYEAEGAPVLHVLPYSRLQRPESTVLLKRIRPRAIIADEVHCLRNRDAVRTHRVISYFNEFPDTRFAGWTGSITDSSIADYAHLSRLALRYQSPLPLNKEVIKEWASALDPKSDWPADPGSLLEGLIATGCQLPGEHVHSGFHRRLVETEGVVTTTTAAISAELIVTERDAPGMPPHLAVMLDVVREEMRRPDGEELLTPLDVARCARELACGFYYRWRYPRGEPEDLIEEWFKARKLWRCELRDQLSPERRREHMDSPFLCQLAAMRAWGDLPSGVIWADDVDEETGEVTKRQVDTSHLPEWRAMHWPRWRKVKDLVKPETEAVRVDDYLARDAAAWALENRGIVWYEKTEFGRWVSEISGLPRYGGGPSAGGLLDDSGHIRERGDRSIILSTKAHGTGRDGLQRLFYTQLVANPPSSATTWEQLLGRLHRIRQQAPRVFAEFYCHTEELQASYHQAKSRALYVQNTIGAAQKLNEGIEE